MASPTRHHHTVVVIPASSYNCNHFNIVITLSPCHRRQCRTAVPLNTVCSSCRRRHAIAINLANILLPSRRRHTIVVTSASSSHGLHAIVLTLSSFFSHHVIVTVASSSWRRGRSFVFILPYCLQCRHAIVSTSPALSLRGRHTVIFMPSWLFRLRHIYIVMRGMCMIKCNVFMLNKVVPSENVSNWVASSFLANDR